MANVLYLQLVGWSTFNRSLNNENGVDKIGNNIKDIKQNKLGLNMKISAFDCPFSRYY